MRRLGNILDLHARHGAILAPDPPVARNGPAGRARAKVDGAGDPDAHPVKVPHRETDTRWVMSVILRWRYLVLALVAGALMAARWHVTGDWDFFVTGSALLRGPHPLSLFATHPQLQIGPLALIAAVPFTVVPGGVLLAKAVIFGGGLVCIRSAELVGRTLRGSGSAAQVLVTGVLFLPVWGFVATSGHLDDAIAVACTCAAMVSLTRNRSLPAGVLLGVAISAKPWAVLALPMVLALPAGRRLRALVPALAIPGLVWLPFLVAAPRSLPALASFHIPLSPYSGLHVLLGLAVSTAYPAWVRPLQFGVALAASLLVARRGVWWAVPAVAFGVRLVLDPGSITYYGAGLSAGALFLDLTAVELPLLSLAALSGVGIPAYLELYLLSAGRVGPALRLATQTSYLRLGTAAAIVVLAVLRSRPDHEGSETAAQTAQGRLAAGGP